MSKALVMIIFKMTRFFKCFLKCVGEEMDLVRTATIFTHLENLLKCFKPFNLSNKNSLMTMG